MRVERRMVLTGRVLHEDDDFITLEVGKHDDVTFHLQTNDEGEVIGGDRFLTLLMIHHEDGVGMTPWLPWAAHGG